MQKEITFSPEEKRSFVEKGMNEARIKSLAQPILNQNVDIVIFVYAKESLYQVIDIGKVEGEREELVGSVLPQKNLEITEEELEYIKNSLSDYFYCSTVRFADVIMVELKRKKQLKK